MPKILLISIFSLLLMSCQAFKPEKVDTRETPINAQERARKNIKEGKGTSLQDLIGGRGGTNFEFSTSNPMWRASLNLLDFAPFSNVDYSGGIIITDWFSNESVENESLKITVKFLSNEIRADGINVIIHKKTCEEKNKCIIKKIDSTLAGEIKLAILREAAILSQQDIEKNKVPYSMPGVFKSER